MLHRVVQHRLPVSLRKLFPEASFVDGADILVHQVTQHHLDCRPGCLFAAIPGTEHNGEEFVDEAVRLGASAVLTSHPLTSVTVPQCVVRDVRAAFAMVCSELYANPAEQVRIAGVTGTNGKTTVSWLIRSMLEQTGSRVGLLGTIEYSDGDCREPSSLTTPGPEEAMHWLRRMVDSHAHFCAMELSSHALHQQRIRGIQLACGLITNITRDHFDYHVDYERYWAAKARIVEYIEQDGILGINIDDSGARRFLSQPHSGLEIRTFSAEREADLQAIVVTESLQGTRLRLRDRTESASAEIEMQTSLVGRHNVSNILAAATAARQLGCSLTQIRDGIEQIGCIPGRLERVDSANAFPVFVDYAHTPDALASCLQFLRPQVRGRLIVVFGAGGDRDREKRPRMAMAASSADVAVVTSDNPRTEDPAEIIDAIVSGFADRGPRVHVDPDRRQAIHWSIREANAQDCVVVAGKGHETRQIIGRESLEFDDRLVARSALHQRGLLTTHSTHRKRA